MISVQGMEQGRSQGRSLAADGLLIKTGEEKGEVADLLYAVVDPLPGGLLGAVAAIRLRGEGAATGRAVNWGLRVGLESGSR